MKDHEGRKAGAEALREQRIKEEAEQRRRSKEEAEAERILRVKQHEVNAAYRRCDNLPYQPDINKVYKQCLADADEYARSVGLSPRR